MSRLESLHPRDMTSEQREAHKGIVSARSRVPDSHGAVYEPPSWDSETPLGGPFEPWLRNPELAQRLVAVGGVLRFGTSLGPRLTELAILVVGRHWTAQFEWWAHERMARQAGVSDAAIEAIKARKEPPSLADDELAVYRFATELIDRKRVLDSTYAAALEQLGEPGVVELVALLGYYTLVSMTLNSFEVSLPEGVAAPLSE